MRSLSLRKEPKQARSKATVRAILDAAAQVLVREGYEGMTTNRVADVAGVSIGSLYQYFPGSDAVPSKDVIVASLLEEHTEAMIAQLEDSVAELLEAPLEVAVPTYIRANIAAHQHEPALHRALKSLLPRLLEWGEIMEIEMRAKNIVQAYLASRADEIVPTDIELAASVLVTTVEANIHSALLEPEGKTDLDALGEELSRLILRYLTGRG